MTKALKIDGVAKTVTEIEVGGLKSWYEAIGNGCTLVQMPVEFDNRDSLFCDEEICLRPDDIKGAFMLQDWTVPIVNNALILGSDDEGESIDAKASTEDIISQIRWFNEAEAKIYASHCVNTPPLIISWDSLKQ